MNKYAIAAIEAVELMQRRKGLTPELAWEKTTLQIFGNGPSQKKGCPKNAFLGLCEEGYIRGIPKGKYTKSLKNKAYAIAAIKYLKANPKIQTDIKTLWSIANHDPEKHHNSQMNIVLTLWESGLIAP